MKLSFDPPTMSGEDKEENEGETTSDEEDNEGEKDFLNRLKNCKKALSRSYLPKKLPGRERNIRDLDFLIRKCIDEMKSEAFFIHGDPGCGKTETITFVLRKIKNKPQKFRFSYLTTQNYEKQYSLLRRIYFAITGVTKRVKKKDILPNIRKFLSKRNDCIVDFDDEDYESEYTIIVLDEIDHLIHVNGALAMEMYQLVTDFENSGLMVIGISNFPPEEKLDLKCSEIVFQRYERDELYEIVKSRVEKYHLFKDVCIKYGVNDTVLRNGDARTILYLFYRVVGRRARLIEFEISKRRTERQEEEKKKRTGKKRKRNDDDDDYKDDDDDDEEEEEEDEIDKMLKDSDDERREKDNFNTRKKKKEKKTQKQEEGEEQIEINFMKMVVHEQENVIISKSSFSTKLIFLAIFDLHERSEYDEIPINIIVRHIKDSFPEEPITTETIRQIFRGGGMFLEFRERENWKFGVVDIENLKNIEMYTKLKRKILNDEEMKHVRFKRYSGFA